MRREGGIDLSIDADGGGPDDGDALQLEAEMEKENQRRNAAVAGPPKSYTLHVIYAFFYTLLHIVTLCSTVYMIGDYGGYTSTGNPTSFLGFWGLLLVLFLKMLQQIITVS